MLTPYKENKFNDNNNVIKNKLCTYLFLKCVTSKMCYKAVSWYPVIKS